ncbi:uncharacterized protein [Cherax quadricarinatus]|uniref:uncharacterized protein n=1 Tax=Cherax quadricarinatus TaxID=27406 RepID=UPI00387E542A
MINAVRRILPKVSTTTPSNSTLQGAPLGHQAIDTVLKDKLNDLMRMEEKISNLDAHDALYLLTRCLTIPRLTHFLRCAPSFDNPTLDEYDAHLRSTLKKALNLSLEDQQWDQATLPVRLGGIGVRKATHVALPAFLSSCLASSALVEKIVPERLRDVVGAQDPRFTEAAIRWDTLTDSSSRPTPPKEHKQSHWDKPIMEKIANTMLSNASGKGKALLLAVKAPHSGDFLLAVPNSSLGTRLDPQAIRIGVTLRLAAPILTEHRCICGRGTADQFGLHGLVCHTAEGKYARHEEVNDIITRSLATARCPAQREPQVQRSDRSQKRPDGATMLPWKDGKQIAWDYKCAATLADTYLPYSVVEGGGAASHRETQKIRKYEDLPSCYNFIPIGSETLGAWGKCALKFLIELGEKLIIETKDHRATSFLF